MGGAKINIDDWKGFEVATNQSPVDVGMTLLSHSNFSVQTDALRPVSQKDARANSLSAIYGLKEQPPHTDGAHLARPPKYLIFWSLEDDPSKTPTILRKFEKKYLDQDFLDRFRRSVWSVRIKSGQQVYVKPVSSNEIFWDPACFLHDATGKVAKTEVEEQLLRLPKYEFYWQSNCALIVNNRNVLHSRAEISENASSTRQLFRATLFE